MHGSFRTEKMNPEFSATQGKHYTTIDSRHADRHKHVDNSKPRDKRNYSTARKLKEKSYVWA